MHTASFVCITFVGFVTNIAWGIVMPSLWYFIEDKNGKHLHLGIAVSAFSLSQIFFLQIYGKWADKRPMKEGLMFSFAAGVASYLLYAFSEDPYMIIIARLLAGIEAGNLTITNSFVAISCGYEERTKYMAKMNGINVVGFIIAPLINLGLMEVDFHIGKIKIDPYKASGLFIVLLHFFIIIIFLAKFQEPSKAPAEHDALLRSQKGKEKEVKQKEDKNASQKWQKKRKENDDEVALLVAEFEGEEIIEREENALALPRRHSARIESIPEISKTRFILQSFRKVYGVCFVAMFVQNFLFSFLVTAITPITARDYHFSPFHNSLMFSATSLLMVIVIFIVSVCSQFIKNIDRIVIIVSQLFMLTSLVSLSYILTLKITFWELCLVVVLLIIGVPGQNTSLSSIYSKFITREYGASKLGQFTGIMLQSGAVAAILGPLWAGIAFSLPPMAMVSLMLILVAIALGWTLSFFKDMVITHAPIPTNLNDSTPSPRKSSAIDSARLITLAGYRKISRQEVASVGLNQFALFADNVEEEEALPDMETDDVSNQASMEYYNSIPAGQKWVKGVVQYTSVIFSENRGEPKKSSCTIL